MATDDGGSPLSSTARVSIAVLDVNDNKPEFLDSFPNPITLREDTAVSSTIPVATFEAVDADVGQNAQVTYSLGGNPDNRFSIGELDGKLYLLKKIDFENQTEFNLLIIATDKGE